MPYPQLVKPVLNPPANITRITDQAGLDKLVDFFSRCGGIFGWDIETTPVRDYFHRKVRTIQFGNKDEQYVIDLRAFCYPQSGDILYDAQGWYGTRMHPLLKNVIDTLAPYLCSDNFLKVGVNLSFEYMTMYWNFGLRTFGFYDCSVAEKCIYAGALPLKSYHLYSMEEMMARYFGYQIDKTLQESFDLECELTDEQCEYACLDVRYPLSIRAVQMLITKGVTYKELKAKNSPAAIRLQYIDPVVTGDNLNEIVKIENDAIGAFQDMHIHGERIDKERWNARVNKCIAELNDLLKNDLDPIFIPIVGKKTEVITDEDINAAAATWKFYNNLSTEEIQLKAQIRWAKKQAPDTVALLEAQQKTLEASRKEKKEGLKAVASELGKKRTRIKNLITKCEGDALVNYSSDAQLLKIIQKMKGLKGIEGLDDQTLEKYSKYPVMAAIRKYHGLKKNIGTYGFAWTTEWVTKPCKEEGWLNPGDGRLHCVFNQYDAETGRSSSEKPNGQNLPQDKEVRSSFVADPPDESIRISTCCDADTVEKFNNGNGGYVCTVCGLLCDTKPEEYVIVTADMSGAELRIIAELANDPIWIGAFNRGEDVHSVGTEILYEEEWPKLQLPDCAYFKLNEKGEPQRKKCKCPEHGELRNNNKSTNFLLAYGGGPSKLAQEIRKPLQVAKDLMSLHEKKFPKIWAYLAESGKNAGIFKKSFDMFGRRRLFPEPTRERATAWFKSEEEQKLRLEDEVCEKNIAIFTEIKGRGPDEEEKYTLTHRAPTDKEISKAMMALNASIGRQGKNHAIQGTNATIIKLAMGCGFDADGKPYLWHTLPQYKAKLIKMVHDELVLQCPKRYAKKVAELVGDAFKRAASVKMKKVTMEFDFNIGPCWSK